MIVHPQYIIDEDGKKRSVVLPISEFQHIMDELDELDELEDIRLYDQVKKSNEPMISFDEFVQQRRGK
ncbi:MAG TPA: hypothetical protein VJ844_01280 [Mucilaginibacter sp.]|nr:hypothetical protein [Mucilaginibacter sp.]